MSGFLPGKEQVEFGPSWYHALGDISPVGIFFTDSNGNCLHVNRRWCEIAGLSPEQARGRGWLQAIHAEDLQRVSTLWYESARDKHPFHAEYRFSSPQGITTWVLGDARAVLDEGGLVKGYVGTITDINESKQQQHKLEQSRSRFRTIIEQMPVILFAFDDQGRLCAWNREAERVTGFAADEVIGNPEAMQSLCPEPDYLRAMLDAYKQERDYFYNWEWQLTAKDGTVRRVEFSNISRDYPVEGWASWGIGIDVTSQKEAEGKLRERVKELTCLYSLSIKSNRPNIDLDKFFQDVVELIPPAWQYPETTCARVIFEDKIFQTRPFKISPWQLSSDLNVRGRKVGVIEVYDMEKHPLMAEGPFLLEERLLIDEISLQLSRTIGHVMTKRDLALLDELSNKAEELDQFAHTISHDLKTPLVAIGGFSQLLDSKLATGDMTQALFCAQRISEVTQRMEQRINELLKLAKMGKIIDPSDEVDFKELVDEALSMVAQQLGDNHIAIKVAEQFPKVIGDRTRLLEVMEGLLDNAIKYIGTPPNQIEIGYRRDNSDTVFFVKDNGVGIQEKNFDVIFELFKRLDEEVSGDGTGLAIIERIVEAHGGRIWVKSEGADKGSCFCFTLGHVIAD